VYVVGQNVAHFFKRLKHRLGLEHTSGLSWQAANQDFGAKAVFDNLNALAAYVATDAHLDPDSPWKINRTLAIDKIKRQIGRWLLAAGPHKPQPKPHLSHAYKAV
jgi:hypothetical protein